MDNQRIETSAQVDYTELMTRIYDGIVNDEINEFQALGELGQYIPMESAYIHVIKAMMKRVKNLQDQIGNHV